MDFFARGAKGATADQRESRRHYELHYGETDLAKQAKTLGGINAFMYADWGLPLLSNCILVSDEYARANPKIVRAFVHASLRGFAYAFNHPDEAIDALLKHQPILDRASRCRSLLWSNRSF